MGFIVIVLWNFSFYSRLLLRHSWVSPGKNIVPEAHSFRNKVQTHWEGYGFYVLLMSSYFTFRICVKMCFNKSENFWGNFQYTQYISLSQRYFFPHASLPFTLVSTSQLIRGTIFFLSVISKAEAHCIVRDQNQNLLQLLRKSVIVL